MVYIKVAGNFIAKFVMLFQLEFGVHNSVQHGRVLKGHACTSDHRCSSVRLRNVLA